MIFFMADAIAGFPLPKILEENMVSIQFLLATGVMVTGFEFFSGGLKALFLNRNPNMY